MSTADTDARALSSNLGSEFEPHSRTSASNRRPLVLIDRRPLARESLGRWLERGPANFAVVSVCSPADLLDLSRSATNPRMIVFSVGAASVKAPDTLGKITMLRQHMGRVPLILLSDRDDVDEIVEAIELGVRGYIPTSIEVSEVAAALHCVEAGGTFVPASAMIRLVRDRQNSSRGTLQVRANLRQHLTPRESEVLNCLRMGKPNTIIAHELAISEGTVKVFVRRILSKMNASNRTELASLMHHTQPPDHPIDDLP